jgi:hypothetical protein
MDDYELTVCQRCIEKHPEWHKEIIDTMTSLFPNTSFSWPANSPNAQKYKELWKKHEVKCFVVTTGGYEYSICKPCLLEIAEGIKE